jgi:hypothetical protein
MNHLMRRSLAMFVGFGLLATGPMPASASDFVPFNASYASIITFTGQYSATLAGNGKATHLGQTTTVGNLAVVGPATTCANGFASEIRDTLTAANGDQVTVLITMEACPAAPGIYPAAGTYVVTGGTGRFSGASGGGAFNGLGDFNSFNVTCALTGTISRSNE